MRLPNLWIFLGALLASGLGVYLVHRYWGHEKRREHTDVAGFIFAGVAVLYAVLLAFVVILGWGNPQQRTRHDLHRGRSALQHLLGSA